MIKEQLFSNWYPLRWVMLVAGLFFGYNYLTNGTAISGLISMIILFQALTNTGCLLGYCSPGSHHQTKPDSIPQDVTFEEIKTK